LCVHQKTKTKLRKRLKELTRRSWNIGYARRKAVLTQTIRGWVTYFRYADMRSFLEDTDQWLRGRIRMCIWKCWKRIRTRFKNLQKCGIPKWQAWQWANSRKGYCRAAHSFMHRVVTNEMLKRAGYPCLMDYYVKLHPC
jgi:hypothetical protein